MNKALKVAKVVLSAIAIAGAMIVVISVPNLASALAQVYPPLRNFRRKQIARAIYSLKSQKIIGITKHENKDILVLTERGKTKLLKYKFEDLKLPRQKKWDNKFRLVFFDIPEKYKVRRNIFSKKLRTLGMLPIQKSVWLWPYNCENEVEYLRTVYEIRPFVTCAVVENIELNLKVKKLLQEKFNIG